MIVFNVRPEHAIRILFFALRKSGRLGKFPSERIILGHP